MAKLKVTVTLAATVEYDPQQFSREQVLEGTEGLLETQLDQLNSAGVAPELEVSREEGTRAELETDWTWNFSGGEDV